MRNYSPISIFMVDGHLLVFLYWGRYWISEGGGCNSYACAPRFFLFHEVWGSTETCPIVFIEKKTLYKLSRLSLNNAFEWVIRQFKYTVSIFYSTGTYVFDTSTDNSRNSLTMAVGAQVNRFCAEYPPPPPPRPNTHRCPLHQLMTGANRTT